MFTPLEGEGGKAGSLSLSLEFENRSDFRFEGVEGGREGEKGAIIYRGRVNNAGTRTRTEEEIARRGGGDLFYRMLNFMRPLRASAFN